MLEVMIVPGINIDIISIIFLGFAVGIISGFVGVGGGFIMTPALMILGVPAHYAVGTSMLWVMGNSVIGSMRHRQHGNVDMKLALITTVFVMAGVEIGVRILNWIQTHGVADEVVLVVSSAVLLFVGTFIFWESSNHKVSRPAVIDTRDVVEYRLTGFIHSITIPPVITGGIVME
jgi:uncharacterized protein